MAGDCSFDIVSQFDEQELVNAIDQTRREVSTRFDLKDTKTDIVHTKDTITIVTDSSLTLKSVRDILETKAVRRGLSLKIFNADKEENAAGLFSYSKVSLKILQNRSVSIFVTLIPKCGRKFREMPFV